LLPRLAYNYIPMKIALKFQWIVVFSLISLIAASAKPLGACPGGGDCLPHALLDGTAVEDSDLPTPREEIIARHLQYFQLGVGVHPAQHLPIESVNALGQTDLRTQPTLIGFYLQILSAVIKFDLHPPFLSRSQAITEAGLVLDKLLYLQQNYGWNGLIPWMYLDPLVPSTHMIGFADNSNLSQSVAVFIGALELSNNFTQKTVLLQKADLFLSNQQAGYQLFFSPQTGKFHGSYDNATHQFHPTYYIDRFMTEFRQAVAFVILRYGISTVAWDSLQLVYRNYQLQNGEQVQNLVPFDGSAFQMFWPAMASNELAVPKMRQVLRNALLTQMDFANRNKLAGILSACLVPEGVYYGKTGVPSAQETVDPLLVDVGSIYSLAAAYLINPDSVMSWIETIRLQATLYYGALGFFDSARTVNDRSDMYLGIDQGAAILGLSGLSGTYFDTYLQNRSLLNSFRSLYDSKLSQLTVPLSVYPNAPDLWSQATTAFRDAYSEGTLNNFQNPISFPNGITFNYQNVSPSTWGGHYWLLSPIDARNKTLIVSFTSRISPGDIKIELKSGSAVRYTQTITIPQSETLGSIRVVLPNQFNYSAITQISVIVEPWRTGITTANFHIHQLGFYTD